MVPDEERLFQAALDIKVLADRTRFLDRVCASNTSLRLRLEELLSGYFASDFLDSTPYEAAQLIGHWCGKLEHTRIDCYQVLELLGEGGMGEVYLAQPQGTPLQQKVALKILKPGMDSRQILTRFQIEQEILQRLNHPNISRFIGSGFTESGRAYFAMEFVPGIPITSFCDRESLTITERIRLLISVCQAIISAHRIGVIHRDLKPSNILVYLQDGKPITKVIDFGVAKSIGECAFSIDPVTRGSQFIGTPAYMSPEQARWSSDVDARTDVYSLGVLLFELLTGALPHIRSATARSDATCTIEQFVGEFPRMPSQHLVRLAASDRERQSRSCSTRYGDLLRQLRCDLDCITMTALSPNRNKRYPNLDVMMEDLESHLASRPIQARKPSPLVRIGKSLRRHRGSFVVASMVILPVVVTTVLFGLQYEISDLQSKYFGAVDTRSQVAAELSHVRFASDIVQASQLLENYTADETKSFLNRYLHAESPYAGHFALHYLLGQADRSASANVIGGVPQDLLDVDVSSDGRYIVGGDAGGHILVWDVANGSSLRQIDTGGQEVTRARFSPTGKLLATAGQDCLIRLWHVGDWKLVGTLSGHERTINGLDWSPDGQKLAVGDREGIVRIWDISTSTCDIALPQHAIPVRCLAWSPDGKQLATASGSEGVLLWKTNDWTQAGMVRHGSLRDVLAIAFTADSQHMVVAGYSVEVHLIEVATQQVVHRVDAGNHVWSLRFISPATLAVGTASGYLKLFEFSAVERKLEHIRSLRLTNVESRQRSIVHTAETGMLYIGSEKERLIREIPTHSLFGWNCDRWEGLPIGVASPLGLMLCADSDGSHAALRRLQDHSVEANLPFQAELLCRPQYSEANQLIAIAGQDDGQFFVYLYHPGTWQLVRRFVSPHQIRILSFSRDGSQLALGTESGYVRVYNVQSGGFRDLKHAHGRGEGRVAFSPTEDLLILGQPDTYSLTCLNAKNFSLTSSLKTAQPWSRFAFHSDGSLVFSQEFAIEVWPGELTERVWHSGTGLHHFRCVSTAFSPDRSLLAMLTIDGCVQVWDWKTHTELFSVKTPVRSTESWLAFSDPHTLLFGNCLEPFVYSISTDPTPAF